MASSTSYTTSKPGKHVTLTLACCNHGPTFTLSMYDVCSTIYVWLYSITASENVEEICRLFLRWVKYTMRVGGPETQGKLAKLFMDFVSVRYTYRIRRVWINKRYHKRYLKGNVLTVLPFCEVAEGLTDIELDFTRVSLNNLPGDFFPCIYSRLYR
jgi:hypothetical protein